MLGQIKRLIETFAPLVEDRSTLDELHRMIDDERSWRNAHDIFDRIRRKTLKAIDRKDASAGCQYCFEEVCAKTLYNLTDTDAPFDEDSPYWIVPSALSLARRLGIAESEITNIVTA